MARELTEVFNMKVCTYKIDSSMRQFAAVLVGLVLSTAFAAMARASIASLRPGACFSTSQCPA